MDKELLDILYKLGYIEDEEASIYPELIELLRALGYITKETENLTKKKCPCRGGKWVWKMNMKEVKYKKRTPDSNGVIKQLGVVYYTVDGAFYVSRGEDMYLRKGVYRLEKGGFLEHYTYSIIDRHLGFGDIYDETFVSKYMGDIIITQILDSYVIYSYNFIDRIAQRCIN